MYKSRYTEVEKRSRRPERVKKKRRRKRERGRKGEKEGRLRGGCTSVETEFAEAESAFAAADMGVRPPRHGQPDSPEANGGLFAVQHGHTMSTIPSRRVLELSPAPARASVRVVEPYRVVALALSVHVSIGFFLVLCVELPAVGPSPFPSP